MFAKTDASMTITRRSGSRDGPLSGARPRAELAQELPQRRERRLCSTATGQVVRDLGQQLTIAAERGLLLQQAHQKRLQGLTSRSGRRVSASRTSSGTS